MTLRLYLALMSIGTFFCWVAWLFVITNISPTEAGLLGLFFFYFSFFLAILGTFSVLGFLIRKTIIKNDDVIFRHVRNTFRQSLLLSTLISIILFLLSQKLLFWWNFALLLGIVIFLEGIIFTNRKHSNG